MRPRDPEVLGDGVHGAREGGGAAGEHRGEDAGAGEDVGQRQEQQGVVAVDDLGRAVDRLGGERDVVVGQHRALGDAGGAGGVDDGGDVRRPDCGDPGVHRVVVDVGAEGDEGVPADHPAVVLLGLAGEQDHPTHGRDPVPDRAQLDRLAGVLGEHHHGVRVLDDVGHFPGQQGVVDADGHRADGGQGDVGQHPAVARVAEDVGLVVGADAEGDEALGHLPHVGGEAAPRDRLRGVVGSDRPVGVPVREALHRVHQHLVNATEVGELHTRTPLPGHVAPPDPFPRLV